VRPADGVVQENLRKAEIARKLQVEDELGARGTSPARIRETGSQGVQA
jgi:hypothetical protein